MSENKAIDFAALRALRMQHKDVFVDPKTLKIYTDKYVAPQVARLLTAIHDEPKGVRNMLTLVKRQIAAQAHDLTPARYFLATKVVIDQLMLGFEMSAMNLYQPDRPEGLICLWDTAHGIDRAFWVIQGIIRELHGETHWRDLLRIDPTGTANPPLFSVTKESGFTLLDEAVSGIHEKFSGVRHGELVIAGAEIGQKIYKALYPLTEGI
jgi:hypothetical protein